jgi:hypothetical protein
MSEGEPMETLAKKRKLDETIDLGEKMYNPLPLSLWRNLERSREPLSLTKLYNMVPNWKNESVICIDGMSGLGKTTLLKSMIRESCKVKVSGVSKSSFYNFKFFHPFDYIACQSFSVCKNVVWDRSKYSNIIFYLVHALMAYYQTKGEQVPNDISIIFPILQNIASQYNILDIVEYFERRQSSKNLFLICSDFDFVKEKMKNRSPLDAWNASNRSYLISQYYCMMFFAKLLKAACLDLKDWFDVGFTLSDVQNYLKIKLDVNSDAVSEVEYGLLEMSDITKFYMHELDTHALMSTYSRK